MTEMQKRFEEWAEKSGFNLKVVFPLIGDASADNAIYANERTRSAWQAWQSSRAAVVVNTDTMKDPSYEATGMVYLDAVEQVLDEAGIRHE